MDLKTWLESNAAHLSSYTVEEIAHLADACGIPADFLYIRQWKQSRTFKEAV